MESGALTKEGHEEEVFLKLYNYDFKSCPKFMEGWTKIRQSITENITESFIKAQVFFYSRQVEHVNIKEYIEWLNSSGRQVKVTDIDPQDTEIPTADVDIVEHSTNSSSDMETAGKHPANFGELIEMIQKGIKLPGVEELNIEPTNEFPSPTKLDRPKKPWET